MKTNYYNKCKKSFNHNFEYKNFTCNDCKEKLKINKIKDLAKSYGLIISDCKSYLNLSIKEIREICKKQRAVFDKQEQAEKERDKTHTKITVWKMWYFKDKKIYDRYYKIARIKYSKINTPSIISQRLNEVMKDVPFLEIVNHNELHPTYLKFKEQGYITINHSEDRYERNSI